MPVIRIKLIPSTEPLTNPSQRGSWGGAAINAIAMPRVGEAAPPWWCSLFLVGGWSINLLFLRR